MAKSGKEKASRMIIFCSRGMRKLNSVNFLMQTDDSTKQAIFDSVCEQRIQVELFKFRLTSPTFVVCTCLLYTCPTQAFSSSPPGESTSPDPWADRTAELTFGTEAKPERELNIEEAQAKLSRIAAAEASSSDEEQDMAPPDRMEVDNDQDRKLLTFQYCSVIKFFFLSLGDDRRPSWRLRGHGHLVPMGPRSS